MPIIPLPSLTPEVADTEITPEAHQLARKWRQFRLQALRTAPEAFAATYEIESQRPLSSTVERLSTSKATHFVAANRTVPAEYDTYGVLEKIQAAIECEWQGVIVLLGPMAEDGSTLITAKRDPFTKATASDHAASIEAFALQLLKGMQEAESQQPGCFHFHLNAIFVLPSARGQGVGLRLIRAALAEAEKLCSMARVKGCKVTILVDEENLGAKKLYARAGFVAVGTEVYVQQARGLVKGEEGRRERVAVLMERVVVVEKVGGEREREVEGV
ncbi:hypothetical protein LTR62_000382 [Meristemomyces frigidus]|uniref:N-acetyltransferase domain-containing protein n=1 Tax=Meristemomyces frigidus TaxID=1508187 RepID=A0AAN7TGW8_9PEZI|nr:hypothetical protein LTR62_000382 [Meristemomyces frigidus]